VVQPISTLFPPLSAGSAEGTASDACARAVRAAILRGDLAPGVRLPPERTLASHLGVSRLTLRAGLSQLAAAGLLRVRQGSGYVVQDYSREGGLDLLSGVVALARRRRQLPTVAEDLLTVRRHLARALFERLVTRWSPAGSARVGLALDAFARASAAGGAAEVASADIDVVTALVREADSAVLGLCLNPIARVLSELPDLTAAMYAEPESNLAGWRVVVAGLDARTPDLPELVMRELERRDQATLRRLARAGRRRR
jgi:GntR family transcriptional regulator, transcriptional repressor for pyruvate dehydrogenase complex